MYNACLIGHGYWGEKLARNFSNSEFFNLVSIVDTKKQNLNSAKKKYPSIDLNENYIDAIKNSLLDLVIIATPTSTHFKIAQFALKNNKHILVEKPLSLSLQEVKKLNKIAKRKKRHIFVDYPFLFSGTINFIKKIIDKKEYGNILEIESYREQAPVRRDANVIWDLCTHDISILNFLIEKPPYKIKTIKKKNLKKFPVDQAYVNLKYKNNLNVFIKNSWLSPIKIRLIVIKFERAVLYCDENESIYKIKIYKNKSKKDLNNFDLKIPKIDLTEPLFKLAKYIFYSIKNNNNHLFKNNFNEKITILLEKINQYND
jgi:predicted dehydrogenase